MALKEKEFIEIEYTGRTKEDNNVFDTTDEKLAKESEIHNPNAEYGPVIICLGQGQILKGLEKKLEGKEIGKHKIEISCQEAFGRKNAGLVKLVPMKRFIEQDIQPITGLSLNIDGNIGTIRHVGGGRVLVDFNHPLAGRDLAYEINVKRIVTDKKEEIQSILKTLLGIKKSSIAVEGDKARITLEKEVPKEITVELDKHIHELTGVHAEFLKEEKAAKPKTEKPEGKINANPTEKTRNSSNVSTPQ